LRGCQVVAIGDIVEVGDIAAVGDIIAVGHIVAVRLAILGMLDSLHARSVKWFYDFANLFAYLLIRK